MYRVLTCDYWTKKKDYLIVMSGGVDALVPFNNESGDIIAQKEERYFNLYRYIKDKGTTDQCL